MQSDTRASSCWSMSSASSPEKEPAPIAFSNLMAVLVMVSRSDIFQQLLVQQRSGFCRLATRELNIHALVHSILSGAFQSACLSLVKRHSPGSATTESQAIS